MPYTQDRKLGNLENFVYFEFWHRLQLKIWKRQRNKMRQKLKVELWFRTKTKISEISEFSILLYTQNQKHGNLRNMSPPSNSDSSYNWRFKNDENMNWVKNWKIPVWFKRKNKNFWDFQVFIFCPIPKIESSEILFTSNFNTDCSSRFKNVKEINWDTN